MATGQQSGHVVHVSTASRSYDVRVVPGILDSCGQIVRSSAGGERAFIVTDTNVGPLYAARVKESLCLYRRKDAQFVHVVKHLGDGFSVTFP